MSIRQRSDSDPDETLRRAEEFIAAHEQRVEEDKRKIRKNECPSCGAYRIDGLPPEVHEHGCPWGADGLERSLRRMFGKSSP